MVQSSPEEPETQELSSAEILTENEGREALERFKSNFKQVLNETGHTEIQQVMGDILFLLRAAIHLNQGGKIVKFLNSIDIPQFDTANNTIGAIPFQVTGIEEKVIIELGVKIKLFHRLKAEILEIIADPTLLLSEAA